MTPFLESEPGKQLAEVAAHLTDAEARELLEALTDYFSGPQAPGWHCHITDADGNELTVGVMPADD